MGPDQSRRGSIVLKQDKAADGPDPALNLGELLGAERQCSGLQLVAPGSPGRADRQYTLYRTHPGGRLRRSGRAWYACYPRQRTGTTGPVVIRVEAISVFVSAYRMGHPAHTHACSHRSVCIVLTLIVDSAVPPLYVPLTSTARCRSASIGRSKACYTSDGDEHSYSQLLVARSLLKRYDHTNTLLLMTL